MNVVAWMYKVKIFIFVIFLIMFALIVVLFVLQWICAISVNPELQQ